MRSSLFIFTVAVLLTTGCGDNEAGARSAKEKKAKPTFMFWCFRKEIVSDTFHVPDMKTDKAANYLQGKMKTVIGYVDSSYDLTDNTLTVEYQSSTVRKMNFQEAIALAGFSADNRPENPAAKVPAGVK